tara:strand:+ start:1262 stop:2230 length:969 start_codon:yes stop_codon:yes gene_type:complete
MGALCTNNPIPLPDASKVISGTTLPEWVSAGGREIYDQARELGQSPFPEYTAPRFAEYGTDETGMPIRMTEREREGLDLLSEGSDVYQDILDQSTEMAGTLGQGFENIGDFSPEMAGQYQNVYQTAIDPAIEELERQRQLQQRDISARGVKSGAFGGSRMGVESALTNAEIARAASDLRRQAGREGLEFASQRYDADRMGRRADFETDEASRLRATETLSGLAPLSQGLQEQAASGLLTAGEAERSLDQRGLDTAYQDYLMQSAYPYEQLNFILGALQGVPYQQLQTQMSEGTQYMQQPSVYGQTLGGLGSLASAYALSKRV